MILQKREKFRCSIRREALENHFKLAREKAHQSNSNLQLIQKYEQLIQANVIDTDFFEESILLLESTNDEDLIVIILRYIEKFDLSNRSQQLSDALIKQLNNTKINSLQFYLIVSITNILSIQDPETFTQYVQFKLLTTVSEILDNYTELDIIPNLLECISCWPYQFIKMNSDQQQLQLLQSIKGVKKYDQLNFYKFLIKITEEIQNEEYLFTYLIKNKYIQEAIEDFKDDRVYVLDFFINLSFLEAEQLLQIISYQFLSPLIFELNKDNKIQGGLYILIRNLLLSNYQIRLYFYDFKIYQHLSYGIQYCLNRLDIANLEEILMCIKSLLQQDEVSYANTKQQVVSSEIELMLQSIFLSLENQIDIFKLTGEILFIYYTEFKFNGNQQFKERLKTLDLELY
ncbi:unnamed protein product [Paramecium octaurelia]|uniref:Uncharacterized protein n=1 Tax=Paramecium octaurelia TaxID=43137 RepID=A0A8S1TE60_PAROT|nr:unnamed protein product [Paramecium octaurelia]